MTHYINRFKGKKNTGSSRCRKKPFDKNLTTFQDGTLNKLQTIHYTNINIINAIMKRAQQWGKNERYFPLRSRRRPGCTPCTTVQQSTETLRAIRWQKEIKGQQIEKEVNLSSFPRDKVSYVKVIKITKETCYIKKDSLITKGSINQLTHYQNCHDNLSRSRIKHSESHRTIQRANSKTPEEGRWRSLYYKTYYKVIKVMWYWYKNR